MRDTPRDTDTLIVEMGAQGRVVIPAVLRRELGIAQGSRLVARLDGAGGLLLIPEGAVKARLRELAVGIPGSLADELIAERRAEAEREDRA